MPKDKTDIEKAARDIVSQAGGVVMSDEQQQRIAGEQLAAEIMPSEAELKEADEYADILVLTRGETANGKDFHAYVSIPPSKFPAFLEVEKRGNYALSDYGEVLHVGDGLEPSEETKKEMQEKHGANPEFQKELMEAIAKEVENPSQ